MRYILAPSILAANFNKLGSQIKDVEQAGAKYLHFDVMDGHFTPNISIGIPVLESIRKTTDLIIDTHLMVSNPEKHIKDFILAGSDIINFHIESTQNPMKLIDIIKSEGKKVGITVKPTTPIEAVFEYVKDIDMVLIMSVEPGFGGQKFIDSSLTKAKKLRAHACRVNTNLDIEMDGGISLDNLEDVLNAGVNIIVSGSSIFGTDEVFKNATIFTGKLRERENLFEHKVDSKNKIALKNKDILKNKISLKNEAILKEQTVSKKKIVSKNEATLEGGLCV